MGFLKRPQYWVLCRRISGIACLGLGELPPRTVLGACNTSPCSGTRVSSGFVPFYIAHEEPYHADPRSRKALGPSGPPAFDAPDSFCTALVTQRPSGVIMTVT